MSRTGGGYVGRHTHRDPNHRAVAEIQKSIIKRGKRNAISRHFHAKNDKEKIAGWMLDLNRILCVFNVRPLASFRRLLSAERRFQTELAITTHVVTSDIHHEVVNTQTIVSDVRQDVTNTHVIVSKLEQNVADIHRTVVKGQDGSDGKNKSVSTTRTLRFISESTLTIH